MLTCHLRSTEGLHEPIILPDGQPVQVGRSPATLITAKNVSRHQVCLNADYGKREVRVEQLGSNPCDVDGTRLKKGATGTLKEGMVLHLLAGEYPHAIKFKSQTPKKAKAADITSPQKSIADYFNSGKKGASESTKKHSADSESTRKRLADDSAQPSSSKRQKVNASCDGSASSGGESDDEHSKLVAERLKKLKENAKKHPAPPVASSSGSPASSSANGSAGSSQVGQPSDTSGWGQQGNLLTYHSIGVQASNKIAAFDIDSTIICTASGKRFPTHAGDWTIMLAEIPGKLKKLVKEDYKIVFFTNQLGIQRGKVKIDDYKKKIQNIVAKLGVPVQVFVASGAGPYRKPGLGMWKYLSNQANDGIAIDVSQSFYVGDAAGRPEKWAPGKKKDFACSDRLYAMNIGCAFHTPEEFFLGQRKAAFNLPQFDPRKLPSDGPLVDGGSTVVADHTEVVVCCGYPASGKSHFARTHLVSKGYVHVNRDTLGTWQKCVAACQKAVSEGKKVVVDNTNPDPESRNRYLKVAKAAGVPCRCFYFPAPLDHCRHNERFREMTDKNHQHINDMIFNSLKNKFQEPKMSEGFSEVLKINFRVSFKDKEQEKLYRMFLMEK